MDLRFGDYWMKRQERQVTGPNGSVDLSARAFDILSYLLDHHGEVVEKGALLEAVWPGIAVEDNTLQVHVAALRKALEPSMIATVHGRGYKYAGPLPEAGVGGSRPQVSHKPVIVVLPFDNLSGDPEQQYFSDGITADIIDRLSRFRAFAVIGHHTSLVLRGSDSAFRDAREKLAAQFVLAGNVRKANDRIRIAARLIDATTEAVLWAQHFDRPPADLFNLQDEVANLVAASIARHLEVQINMRSMSQSTANLSSYENLLLGYWHFRRKLDRAGNLAARACFARAVELDPGNAGALAWLGVTYCEQWVQDFKPEFADEGCALIDRAIEIDGANAIIHAIHTWASLCMGDRAGALRASARGLALNPGDPAVLTNRALALAYDGSYAEARELLTEAQRLEPLPPLWFGEFAGILAFAEGRYHDTLAGVEAITDPAWDLMYTLACYGHLGEVAKARSIVGRLRRDGLEIDWQLGMSREPYRDPAVVERLAAGLGKALSF